MTYLTAVLTDLLHTQRDPLALCLLLQAYDTLELPVLPCCQRLSRFNRYYSLWIPEPAREALVSWGCGSDHFLRRPGLRLGDPGGGCPWATAGCTTALSLTGYSL